MGRLLGKIAAFSNRKPVKWALRIVNLLLLAIAALLLVQLILLPWLVHKALARTLASFGLQQTRFAVRSVSPWQTDLAEIDFGPGGFGRIGSVSVTYSPLSLKNGQVNAVRIRGAEIDLRIRDDGSIDLGTFSMPPSREPAAAWPFDRVELRSSAMMVHYRGKRAWVPLAAALDQTAPNTGKVSATIRIQGMPVELAGEFGGKAKNLNLTVEADDLDPGSLTPLLPPELGRRIPSLTGASLHLKLHVSRDDAGQTISLDASGRKMRLLHAWQDYRISADDVGFAVSATLSSALEPTSLALRIDIGRLAVDDQLVRNVSVTADRQGDSLTLHAAAIGSDWQLRRFKGVTDGIWSGRRNEFTTKAEFSAGGNLPPALLSLLRSRQIDATGIGTLSAEGKATANISLPMPGDPRLTWQVRTDELQVSLSAGDLSLARGEVMLRGMAGIARVAAQVDKERVRASVLPGSNIWVKEIQAERNPVRLNRINADAPLLVASVDGSPADIALDFVDGRLAEWKARVPTLSIRAGEVDAAWAREAGLAGASAVLRLAAEADADRTIITALDGSQVRFHELWAVAGESALRVRDWALDVVGADGRPLLELASDAEQPAQFAAQIRSARAFSLTSRDVDAELGSLVIDAMGQMRGSDLAATGVIRLEKGAFRHKPQDLRVAQVNAQIPLAWNAPMTQGRFSLEGIQVGNRTLEPIRGTLGLANLRAEFEATSEVVPDLIRVSASGHTQFNAGQWLGDIKVNVPRFQLQESRQLATLVPEIRDFDLSGQLAADARIEFRGTQLSPRARLMLNDVAVGSREYETSAQGVTGTIEVEGFNPLRTPGGQRLDVRQATTGQLKFEKGVITFRIEDTTAFHVEGTDWGFAGGRVYTNSFRFDLDSPRLDLTLSGDKLQLRELLSLVAEKKLTGNGTLYGRLPVRVNWPTVDRFGERVTDWPSPRLEFGEGFLYATPGGGKLMILDQTLLEPILAQDPRFGKDGQLALVKERLQMALADLSYSVLKMDLEREGPGLVARVHVAGKGQKGNVTQEIGGLTVNIRGFESILKDLFVVKKKLSFGQ